MESRGNDPDDTKLASRFTVADYKKAYGKRDREAIAEAIRRRFTERYVSPVSKSKAKHGCTLMAISCLMIETLESFRQGWRSTDGLDEQAFHLFFARAPPSFVLDCNPILGAASEGWCPQLRGLFSESRVAVNQAWLADAATETRSGGASALTNANYRRI